MKFSIIKWEIIGHRYGRTETEEGFDISFEEDIDIDDDFLDNLINSDNETNFLYTHQNFSMVEDFKITEIKEYNANEEKKRYQLILNMSYFYDGSRIDAINNAFKKEFKYAYNFTLIDFELLNNGPELVIDCASFFPFEKVYPESIYTKEMDINNNFFTELDSEYQEKEFDNIIDINGRTLILEGDLNFTDACNKIIKKLDKENLPISGISNLYNRPDYLSLLKDLKVDNLIIQTTGFNPKLKGLIEAFKVMNFIPKRVFFLHEYFKISDKVFKDVKYYKVNLSSQSITKL